MIQQIVTDVSDTCQPLFERSNKTPLFLPSWSSQALGGDREIIKEFQDSVVSNMVGEAQRAVDTYGRDKLSPGIRAGVWKELTCKPGPPCN